MRIAALTLALFTGVASVAGIVSPDTGTALRRLYYTPHGLLIGGAIRVAMGLVLILAASDSRWPKTIRTLGAVMCLQGIAANLMGLDRARAILEWEGLHTVLLRLGALVAFACSILIAFALTNGKSSPWPNVRIRTVQANPMLGNLSKQAKTKVK